MNVTIIAPDNRVAVDNHFRTVPLDMPDIVAVRFDGETASIEYRPYEGDWKPPAKLTAAEFAEQFGHVIEAWNVAPDDAAPETMDSGTMDPSEAEALKKRLADMEAKVNALVGVIEGATQE